jgi:hypothetical protein
MSDQTQNTKPNQIINTSLTKKENDYDIKIIPGPFPTSQPSQIPKNHSKGSELP